MAGNLKDAVAAKRAAAKKPPQLPQAVPAAVAKAAEPKPAPAAAKPAVDPGPPVYTADELVRPAFPDAGARKQAAPAATGERVTHTRVLGGDGSAAPAPQAARPPQSPAPPAPAPTTVDVRLVGLPAFVAPLVYTADTGVVFAIPLTRLAPAASFVINVDDKKLFGSFDGWQMKVNSDSGMPYVICDVKIVGDVEQGFVLPPDPFELRLTFGDGDELVGHWIEKDHPKLRIAIDLFRYFVTQPGQIQVVGSRALDGRIAGFRFHQSGADAPELIVDFRPLSAFCRKCKQLLPPDGICLRGCDQQQRPSQGASMQAAQPQAGAVAGSTGGQPLVATAPLAWSLPPLVKDGPLQGPFLLAAMRTMWSKGEVTNETYVWRDGLPNWVAICNDPQLVHAISGGNQPVVRSQPPAPPPPPAPASSAAAPTTGNQPFPPPGHESWAPRAPAQPALVIGAKFCEGCGHPRQPSAGAKFCEGCGHPRQPSAGAKFCEQCARPFPS